MKRVNVTIIASGKVLSAYKKDSEYQSWIDECVAYGVWGQVGEYTVEVLDATTELEQKRQEKESASKIFVETHVNNKSNPHEVSKDQIGLSSVDNVSAADLRNRATHTGTQLSSTISDFNEAAQDAVGNSLLDSVDINFSYPDIDNQITAVLTDTGVVAGTYSVVAVDSKGRVTAGSSPNTVERYIYNTTGTTSNSNNTYSTVGQLTTDSLLPGFYRFKFIGVMQSGSTASGVGVRISNGTATLTTCIGKWFITQGANGLSQNYQYDQLNTATNVVSASSAAANTSFLVQGEGVFRITSTGTVVIQIRPEVNGTAASLLAESSLVVEFV